MRDTNLEDIKFFCGYSTACGVPIRFCVNGTFAWECDGEFDSEKPLCGSAASCMYWYEGNEVIYGLCSQPCEAALYIGPESKLNGEKRYCVYCKASKTSEYDGSFREEKGENHISYHSWVFRRFLETGVLNCGCVYEGKNGKPEIRYEADWCSTFQPHGCEHEICFVTKKKRNLAVVNILADIKYRTGEGILEKEVIQKGIKLWGPLVQDIAERKMKEKLIGYKKWPESWQYEHRSKLHGCIPTRVYTAKGGGKDVKQDLADIAEGYEVIHASDLKKAAVVQKRQRKIKRRQAKLRKLERNDIKNWLAVIQDDNTSPAMKLHAEAELSRRNINYASIIQNESVEQLTLTI